MLRTLRLARRLQVWVLLLFACSVGAALAAPWITPSAHASVVCSEQGGVRLAWGESPDNGQARAHELQCPLCLPVGTAHGPDLAAATLDPITDAACIGVAEGWRTPLSALRPPARAPPQDFQPLHEVTS